MRERLIAVRVALGLGLLPLAVWQVRMDEETLDWFEAIFGYALWVRLFGDEWGWRIFIFLGMAYYALLAVLFIWQCVLAVRWRRLRRLLQ